jgi:serine/threonine protein kinase
MSGNLHTGDSLIGITVDHGRYEIVKLIGEGGMGRVFQARQVSMNRMVALKLLRAQLATDDHLLARFQQEAHAVSKLRHPNTIIVYDYGKTEDGYLFIAMELLGGKSLASILSAEQRLMQFRALHIMEQVAGAVAEAHQFGIVHRDLKPENIQIDKVANDPDFAKVLDFGIAKMIHGEGEGGEHRKTLTMAGAVFGTPHYMSPEQVHGQKVDHRTDIYALGIILYELLTGKPIFEGATPMAVMMAQASKPPPDIRQSHPELDVIDTVADLIDDCLVKDADKRLGSANEYIDRVKHAMFQLNQDITGSASGRLLIDPSLLGEERRAARARAAQPQNMAVAETVVPVNEASTAPLGHPVAGKPTASAPGSMRASAPETDDEPVALPKRRTGLFVGLGAAAVAAAGVAIALRPGPPPPEPQPPAPTSDTVADPAAQRIRHEIESTPARATVTRDGAVIGKTPLRVLLKPHEVAKLTLSLAGYQDKTVDLAGTGPNEQSQVIDLVPAAPAPPSAGGTPTAWFSITSTPPDAEIWVADKLIGKTPFEWKPPVAEAPVELRIGKRGFKLDVRTVKLTAAGAAAEEVKVALVAAPAGAPGPGPAPATRAPGPAPATRAPAPASAAAPGTKPKAPESKAPEPTYEKL